MIVWSIFSLLMSIAFGFFGVLVGVAAANRQGYSLAMGALCGFLLGPLSILMFFIGGSRGKCPDCAEWVKKEAKICPHCRLNLTGQVLIRKETPKVMRWFLRVVVFCIGFFIFFMVIIHFYMRYLHNKNNQEVALKEAPVIEQVIESVETKDEVPEGILIPRSVEGDQGKYYLLEVKRSGNIIAALHKRIGGAGVGYTKTETNCDTMLMREMGYSDLSPERIVENPSPWFELTTGSSKTDLGYFVCSRY